MQSPCFSHPCLVHRLLAAAGFLTGPAEAGTRPFADTARRAHGIDPGLVHAVIAVESG